MPGSCSRPLRARIDLAALRHNYGVAKAAAPGAKAWAVIKANAYGHGMWRAVEALCELADGFAVLEPENAVALRDAGVTQPILLLEGFFDPREIPLLVQGGLTSVTHTLAQLEALAAYGGEGRGLKLYLKLNTGMNRLGLVEAELPQAKALLAQLPAAEVTWMTHFADADAADSASLHAQLERFRQWTKGWSGPVSLANSAAILRHPETHGDWVRPGIMLYGGSPFADQSADDLGLKPVMSLESALIATQTVAPGERVGYGGLYRAERAHRVGIVACGYADGYPRHAGTGTPIAVCGKFTHTLGRVSMDMLAVDLSDISEAVVGAPVTLWGAGAGGRVAADAVAAAAGTISYELFCALAARVPVTV